MRKRKRLFRGHHSQSSSSTISPRPYILSSHTRSFPVLCPSILLSWCVVWGLSFVPSSASVFQFIEIYSVLFSSRQMCTFVHFCRKRLYLQLVDLKNSSCLTLLCKIDACMKLPLIMFKSHRMQPSPKSVYFNEGFTFVEVFPLLIAASAPALRHHYHPQLPLKSASKRKNV